MSLGAVRDLVRVKGIGQGILKKIHSLVTVGETQQTQAQAGGTP